MVVIRSADKTLVVAQAGPQDATDLEEPGFVGEAEVTKPYARDPLLVARAIDESDESFKRFMEEYAAPTVLNPSWMEGFCQPEHTPCKLDIWGLVSFHWKRKFNSLAPADYARTGKWKMDEMKRTAGIAHALIQTTRHLNGDDNYKPTVLVLGPGRNWIEIEFWIEMGAKVVVVESEASAILLLRRRITNENFILYEELPEPDFRADIIVATHPDTTRIAYLQPEHIEYSVRYLPRSGFFLIQTDDPSVFNGLFHSRSLEQAFTRKLGIYNFFMPSGYLTGQDPTFHVLVKK